MSRPIGRRLRQVCEFLETSGLTRPPRIAKQLELPREAVYVYLKRAMSHGLVTRTGQEYEAATGWRATADMECKYRVKQPKPINIKVRHALDDWMRTADAINTGAEA